MFSESIPTNHLALISEARKIVHHLEKLAILYIHWTPGHKEIEGNEIADQLAKKAASEIKDKPQNETNRKKDKSLVVKEIRNNLPEQWQRQYENGTVKEQFLEIFPEVLDSEKTFINRKLQVTINQLLTGHCKLNKHMSKMDPEKTEGCPHCGE